MSALLLSLSLLVGPRAAHAQEQIFQPAVPMTNDLTLQPSPPDAAPPQIQPPAEVPVGVAQPNPDFQADMDRRNEGNHVDDQSRRNTPSALAQPSGLPKAAKLHLARMEKGPDIATNLWKSGHWFHGKHDGSFAWWWVVDTHWFRYTKYVYPFPDHAKRQVYIPHSGATSLSSVTPAR